MLKIIQGVTWEQQKKLNMTPKAHNPPFPLELHY